MEEDEAFDILSSSMAGDRRLALETLADVLDAEWDLGAEEGVAMAASWLISSGLGQQVVTEILDIANY